MQFLHSLWLLHAKDSPEIIAIEDVSGKYTYAQVANSANLWCEYLHSLKIKRLDHLVIISDSSYASICMLIGCSMCGVVFTVISPETPIVRRNNIIDDLQPCMIVFDNNVIDLQSTTECIERDHVFNRFSIENRDTGSSNVSNESLQLTTDPAYIVFTSGSTGRPKGIVMSHRAIVSFWSGLIEHAQLSKDKRYVSMSPLQFDFALLDIGLCMGSGATLILPNRGLLRKPKQLLSQLSDLEITHFSGVPTLWKMFLHSAPEMINKLTKLEQIIFAGEHFPSENMCEISDSIKDIEFYNIYGQSESIACTFHVLKEADFRSSNPHMPVGNSHRDMELFLIGDDANKVTQPGEMGELHLKGSTLFSGYWKLPEQTKKSLIQNPLHDNYVDFVFKSGDICYFDDAGLYYFIGRKDNQININGNRVELEEIEAALNRYPAIINSCALIHDNCLHAVLIMSSKDAATKESHEASLRSFLNKGLPSYMLPKHYHFINTIPVSDNGKNDRNKLVNALRLNSI